MKILEQGKKRSILSNSIKISDQLEPGVYSLGFGEYEGFYLMKREDFAPQEKIYGKMSGKIPKIFSAFEKKQGNLGVLLSGERGLGKSMFMRELANEAVKKNIPVICIEEGYCGLSQFISSVEVPVVWLLDEFEKKFLSCEDEDSSEERKNDGQNQFLSILDGTSNSHHLFVATCNRTEKISKYFLNRPGRFYYHFLFKYPCEEEIREFMTDHSKRDISDEINKLISFSKFGGLNYDSLKSISNELNLGFSLEETMEDLNVSFTSDYLYGTFTATTEDGGVFEARFDVYSESFIQNNMSQTFYFRPKGEFDGEKCFCLTIHLSKMAISKEGGVDLNCISSSRYMRTYRGHRKDSKVKLKSLIFNAEKTYGGFGSFFENRLI